MLGPQFFQVSQIVKNAEAYNPPLLNALARFGCIHQARHVPIGVLILMHQLMGMTNLIERVRVRKTWIDFAINDHPIERGSLLVIGQVAALETLLHHPVVTEIHGDIVASGTCANHHHTAGVADEAGRR